MQDLDIGGSDVTTGATVSVKREPVKYVIHFLSEGDMCRNTRSMAKGHSISFPFSWNHGFMHSLRRSLSKGNLCCDPLKGDIGNGIPMPPC